MPVVAIREATMLRVENGVTTVLGSKPARLFKRGDEPVDVDPGQRVELSSRER